MQTNLATAGSGGTNLARDLRALAELVDQTQAASLDVAELADGFTLADALTFAHGALREALAALALGIRLPLVVRAGSARHEAPSLGEAVATVAEIASGDRAQPVVILDAAGADVTARAFLALCGRDVAEVQP